MKKLASLILAFVFVPSVFAASTMHVINASVNYTLYFNTIAMGNCYPQFKEYYPSSPSGAGYCDLSAGGSISFNTYLQLESYYSGLLMSTKTSSTGSFGGTSIMAADMEMGIPQLGIDWAVINYKMESATDVEGVSLGSSDYSSCHGLPDSWGSYGTTDTYSYFTIGGTNKYFVAGEY
ncbi:MAG: hypothetical protein Q4G18_12130 [Myroides sp.]|nr:hypothetical protein [Myroides sp.]